MEQQKNLSSKRDNLERSIYFVKKLISADQKIQRYCEKNKMNYLLVRDAFKEFTENFFVVNFLDFEHHLNQNNLCEKDATRKICLLFKLLQQINFLRHLEQDFYLISEAFDSYSYVSMAWVIDDIRDFYNRLRLDELNPKEVIDHYRNEFKEDSFGATEAQCKFFGYEYCDEFIICN